MSQRKLELILLGSVLLLLAMFFFPATVSACPTCQDQLSQAWAFGFALSVLFMVSMPFLLVGLIGLQLARAFNPQGYELFQERVTYRFKSSWAYVAIGLVLFSLLWMSLHPDAAAKTVPLPRTQLVAQTNLNGPPLGPTQLENKIVLLNFFASWCIPCRGEVSNLGELYRQYQSQGVEIVGVTLDFEHQDEAAALPHIHPDGTVHFHALPNQLQILLDFIHLNRVSYPIIPSAPQVSEPFGGIEAIPATYLFDRQGTLVKSYVGPPPMETLKADVEQLIARTRD